MAANNSQLAPWISYYTEEASKPGPFRVPLDQKGISFWDDVPKSYLGNLTGFLLEISASDGYNFIIVPAGSNHVRMVHQGFVYSEPGRVSPSIVGIVGPRTSSPFKKVWRRRVLLR